MSLQAQSVVDAGGEAVVFLKNDDPVRAVLVSSVSIRIPSETARPEAVLYVGSPSDATELTRSGNGSSDDAVGTYVLGPAAVLVVRWTGATPGLECEAFITGQTVPFDVANRGGVLRFGVASGEDLLIPALDVLAGMRRIVNSSGQLTAPTNTLTATQLYQAAENELAFITSVSIRVDSNPTNVDRMQIGIVPNFGTSAFRVLYDTATSLAVPLPNRVGITLFNQTVIPLAREDILTVRISTNVSGSALYTAVYSGVSFIGKDLGGS